MRTSLKPLLNLAIAALISQSAPECGAHLLSCGFTQALRTIQSSEATKRSAALGARRTERADVCHLYRGVFPRRRTDEHAGSTYGAKEHAIPLSNL